MKTAVTAARILLGLLFFVAGLSGFVLISNPPPLPPGLAGEFQTVFFRSRWVLFVGAVQLIAGVLLLTNRFVPLALVLLGAVLSNILVFHLTMAPSGIVPGLVATALWAVVGRSYWPTFAPLFVPKAQARDLGERARQPQSLASARR
ncbi:MAG: DoxX family protein [Vulcanimicrobiaceae bacterium]